MKTTVAATFSAVMLACSVAGHAQSLPNWYEVRGGAWQVSPDTVMDMAARIASAASRDLQRYTVQYQGISSGQARVVRLTGVCDTSGMDEAELSEKFMVFLDGGTCIFDATYDPAQRRFTEFAFHGR